MTYKTKFKMVKSSVDGNSWRRGKPINIKLDDNQEEKCRLAKTENCPDGLKMITYNCDQVKILHEKWKAEFRFKNKIDDRRKDRYYDEFCKNIDDFLLQCKCKEN